MEKSNRTILYALIIAQVLICAVAAVYTCISIEQSETHTEEALRQQALHDAEGRLRERVDHILTYIDRERAVVYNEVKLLGESIAHSVVRVNQGELHRHLLDWSAKLAGTPYGASVTILLQESEYPGITLFEDGTSTNVTNRFKTITPANYARRCPYYEIVSYDGAKLYIFAAQEDLDAIVKAYVYDLIHASVYGTDGYVWVNEVLNYNGGEQYAIRRIHPDAKDTEGSYLSTGGSDIAGEYPYLAELDAVKSDGEIFHTYELSSSMDGSSTQTASYAELYEPFDWIVAAGEPLDGGLLYADELQADNRDEFQSARVKSLVTLAVVFGLNFLLIFISTRKFKTSVETRVEKTLREREQIFNLAAQHSNRILYTYDIAAGVTRPLDAESGKKDVLSHLYTNSYSEDDVEKNKAVLPDCVDNVKAFFADIHSGVPSGEVNVHISLTDGQLRWYHFKYSSIFDADRPTMALISVEDITERHTHELSHLRHVQSVEGNEESLLVYIECDLTVDQVEDLAGQILTPEEKATRCAYSELRRELLNLKFRYEDFTESSRYFSCEYLLEQYARGERKLHSEWKVRFNDYRLHWLAAEIMLMTDPYNNHVKASIRMRDVTQEREEQLSILHRADFDAMTGLLRKDVGETRIKKHLEMDGEKGGIFIILDLDDLKGINDTLGHKQGDAAIVGIANTLKSHFRRGDVLVRAGGDEFIAYLPGAGQSVHSVERSLTTLLKKLSEITIGENGERMIQCSAGCAVEQPGRDTYDMLFKRADMALYHVKRNGKNNFSFYVPEMEQADYEFRSKKLLSVQYTNKYEQTERQSLIDSITSFYQLVLSVNVNANTYFMMEEVPNGVFSRVPSFGDLESFVQLAAKPVHPEDLDAYMNHLSREALLHAYRQGKKDLRLHFRFLDQGKYRWIECLVIFYTNEQGEACDFTMLRWDDEHQ